MSMDRRDLGNWFYIKNSCRTTEINMRSLGVTRERPESLINPVVVEYHELFQRSETTNDNHSTIYRPSLQDLQTRERSQDIYLKSPYLTTRLTDAMYQDQPTNLLRIINTYVPARFMYIYQDQARIEGLADGPQGAHFSFLLALGPFYYFYSHFVFPSGKNIPRLRMFLDVASFWYH